MKRKFLTCAGSLTLLLVVIIVGATAGLKLLQSSFEKSILEELGFSSQEEYTAFTEKLNEAYDETTFYQNTYTDADKATVQNALEANIIFADGSSLFLNDGYFNIVALEKEDNAQLTAEQNFTFSEYTYFSQLLLLSIYYSDEENNSGLKDMQILSFVVNADGTQTVVIKLSTASIKASMKSYGEKLPDVLYLTLNFAIVVSNTEFEAVNATMQVNKLDAETNKKCNEFLNKVFNSSNSAKAFSEVFLDLTNAFDIATNANSSFTTGGVMKTPKIAQP